jgi:hypothetical protein
MSYVKVHTDWQQSHNKLTQMIATILQLTHESVRVRVRVTLRLAVYRQSVRLGAKPLETHDQIFFSTKYLRLYSLRNILSDERMGLSFTTAVGPRQRSNHSQVRVPWDSWPHFTVSDSRLPQPGGPGLRIYIPQEEDDSVNPQALGSIFVASYDSQVYGRGIRAGLHTGITHDWLLALTT